MSGLVVAGAGERALAAVHALDRALEATATAARLLRAADDVVWTGAGAAGYRDALGTLVDDVQRARSRLVAARTTAADHARAVRADEARDEAAARAAGLPATLPAAPGVLGPHPALPPLRVPSGLPALPPAPDRGGPA